MKRRNAECGKFRRPIKRNKIGEGIYGSTLLYFKFLVLWILVLLADYILEFRFEYLWPFWLLLRSVYDSFKYQGLAFSVFFICIALTSDMICFLFIPVQWLFFAASTYVWVQYVWHTEKGICVPTVILWLLFVYMEVAIRLKDFRHLPFHLDLCRPFAAHCIGYPVVTLGFGFKGYVSYRMRLRKQREVAKENEFFVQLLQEALPAEEQLHPVTSQDKSKAGSCREDESLLETPPSIPNGNLILTSQKPQSNRKSGEGAEQKDKVTNCIHLNGVVHPDTEYLEKKGSLSDPIEIEGERRRAQSGKWNNSPREKDKELSSHTATKDKEKEPKEKEPKEKEKRSKIIKENNSTVTQNKDEYCQRIEMEMRKLKSEMQSCRQAETELRSQLVSAQVAEKNTCVELSHLRHEHETLQNRIQSLTCNRQIDRQTICSLEKRLADERKGRLSCETQLATERRLKKEEAIRPPTIKVECSDICRQRRRETEAEIKLLRAEVKRTEDRLALSEKEVQSLLPYKENCGDTELMLSALGALSDKNAHLENSLSAETRLKLDLFSALGEAKRHLELKESLMAVKEREVDDLKGKMAEVLALVPHPQSYGHILFGSKLLSEIPMVNHSPSPASSPGPNSPCGSSLDPNATAYTPKGSLMSSHEV